MKINQHEPLKLNPHLLDTIMAVRCSVGEGLNDSEFTCLLRQALLPKEVGFAFLNFSEGFVMLRVPSQDLSNWYLETGLVTPEKESLARVIGKKHDLLLYEPTDTPSTFWSLPNAPRLRRHHLELSSGELVVVVAHPYYLKVRLLGRSPHFRYDWETRYPIKLNPDLLPHLSALYADAPDGECKPSVTTQALALDQRAHAET